jgi:hypothetical protein
MSQLRDAGSRSRAPVRVLCPGCDEEMAETECHAIMFSRGLVQAMYRCENCGTETTRTLKRDLTIALT